MLVFLTAFAAATLAPLPAHDVTVAYGGRDYHVSYRPSIRTDLRTVGTSVGSRPSTERCRWSASMEVARSFGPDQNAQMTPVTLANRQVASGSHPGHCDQARTAIEAQIARKAPALDAHVAQVVAQDRAAVLSDIDTARRLAAN